VTPVPRREESEVFTFTDGLVSRLETYHVNLGAPAMFSQPPASPRDG
jgi:hypothetical protein